MSVCTRIVTGAMLMLATAGCTTFDGMPRPVIDPSIAAKIPEDYQMATVLEEMAELDLADEAERKALRNRTIAIYMAAADARYHEFRIGLSRDTKGANFGLELGIVALTGVGAVAQNAANELSAAAAGLSGAKGAINRELYFEKTLPAIIAAMDTNRLRIRGQILQRLRQDSTVDYPLEQAFADFNLYQMASSIDGAIQQITTAAGNASAEEFARYDDATESCMPTAEVGVLWKRLSRLLYDDLANITAVAAPDPASAEGQKVAALALIAALVSDTPQTAAATATNKTEAVTQAGAINDDVTRKYCTAAAVTSLFAEIKPIIGKDVP